MGISREVADAVLAAIRADAAARPSGKARTAHIIAALNAQGIEATPPAIRILAGSIDIVLERAAEAGKGAPGVGGARPGAGRPRGRLDRSPRERRSDAGTIKDSTVALAATARESYQKTKSLRATGAELGISAERVRQLVSTDEESK